MALGIRLITVDRPGFGISEPKADRTFLQFCDDIYELAQVLHIQKFSALGVSGGGVYAAACASKYPDVVHKAGLISTVNQFKNGRPPKEMAFANRFVFTLARRLPWFLKFFLNQQKNIIDHYPDKYLESIRKNTKHLCASDQEVMSKPEIAEVMLMHMKEAFKQGVHGTIFEARLFASAWDFDRERIKVPVVIWHGCEDTLAPMKSIQALARNLPNCTENYVEDKGHFLTEDDDLWRRILISLRA